MSLPNLIVVAGVLQRADGCVFLARRPANKPYPLCWELPGGKVEVCESPENALVRELFEEIGIEVDPKDLEPIGFSSHPLPDRKVHMILLAFGIKHWKGEITPKEGQSEMAWVSIKDLASYGLPEEDLRILKSFQ